MIRSVFISLCLIVVSASPSLSQDARLRSGGGANSVVASSDYDSRVFARRLGHVSAVARHEDGTIYTADQDSGRIFRIQDRRMDGAADMTQPLPHRFDRPTGLAVAGDILFVSDKGGLWRVQPGGGTPTLIAPFANSGSRGDVHPITLIAPTTILLGLSRTDGTARLLEIDTLSGNAHLREEAKGRIIAFASLAAPQSDDLSEPKPRSDAADFPSPWILMDRDGKRRFGSTLRSARSIDVDAKAVWIDELSGRALVSLPDGVYSTVATFAGLTDKGNVVLSGFAGSATPGAIISDARGLFIADQAGGRLWRVSPKAAPMPDFIAPSVDEAAQSEAPNPDSDSTPETARSTRPELMRGSGISSASTLGRASTMPSASTMPEADGPRSASDPDTSDPGE